MKNPQELIEQIRRFASYLAPNIPELINPDVEIKFLENTRTLLGPSLDDQAQEKVEKGESALVEIEFENKVKFKIGDSCHIYTVAIVTISFYWVEVSICEGDDETPGASGYEHTFESEIFTDCIEAEN